jgi:uncharacterized RDD family membrane protein YckC
MADSSSTHSPSAAATNAQPRRTSGQLRHQFQDQLAEEYTIDTPENVTFGYEVAGIGSRFVAAMLDNIILTIILVGLNVALVVALAALAENSPTLEVQLEQPEEDWIAGALIAIYALLNFLIWWGYYMLFEWLWHGQTPGKRSARIRVVRADGAPLSFMPVAVRNLVRIVDFLPAGYGVGVITMFCNRQSRRLGDFAAGTLVVKDQGEVTIQQLMAQIPATASTPLRTEVPTIATPELPPNQDWSGIRRLNAADYALVQETLARHKGGQLDTALLRRVATAIATKVEGAPSSQLDKMTRASLTEHVAFLEAVATAYGRWVR